jgi:hypothetical protein
MDKERLAHGKVSSPTDFIEMCATAALFSPTQEAAFIPL